MRSWRIRRLGAATLIFASFCTKALADPPVKLWEYQIADGGTPSGTGVRRGNGVVAAQDSTSVWLTTDDGSVRLLRTDSGGVVSEARYDPTPLAGRSIECQSSLSLYESQQGGVQFAVYAVIDVPDSNKDQITSRIISLSPSGTKRWEVTIDGIAVGTPQIGANGINVFITHNARSSTTGTYDLGKLSLFRNDLYGMGDEVPLDKAGGFGYADKRAPFGPLTVFSLIGMDTVYWAEAWENGKAGYGMTYKFDSSVFQVTGLSRTSSSTMVAPTLSMDGKSMWIGGSHSSMIGWTNGRTFTARPQWTRSIDPSVVDSSLPISTQPVLTQDGTRICGSSAGSSVFCLDAVTGEELWNAKGADASGVSTRITPDGNVLFAIWHDQGLVRKYYVYSGRVLAEFSCSDLTRSASCQYGIDADFSISDDGTNLYFSDRFGSVVALKFAIDVFEPTISPAPSKELSVYPSRSPLYSTSLAPMSSAPSQRPTQLVLLTPSIQPPASIPTSTLVPPSMSPAVQPSNSTPEPSAFSITLDYYEVDFDSILAETDDFVAKTSVESSALTESNSQAAIFATTIIVAVFVVLVMLSLGIVVGRLWQLRRMHSHVLPTMANKGDAIWRPDKNQSSDTQSLVERPADTPRHLD